MSRSMLVLSLVAAAGLVACGGAKTTSSTPAARSSQPAAMPANGFTGTVAETMNSGGYTYARLQASGKEDVWIAATEFETKQGDNLTVGLEMPMQDFQSKTLNRTFPLIYFVSNVARDGQALTAGGPHGAAPAMGLPMASSHGPSSTATTVEPIAPPPGGMSIADVWAQRTSFGGKEVTIRGQVVKVNTAIMGRNWIHLQDGSGSASDRTNDLTVTTDADLNVGDVVTVTGVLAVGKDFGAGYAYDAIVENAKIVTK